MRNAYVDLCIQVQAARRSFEAIRTPLAPAVGVAASLYTHQLANVHRVLTDVRVRHLLADEVGLGKTVQALMILNALRQARPELTAVVVVHDKQPEQWQDELLTRCHAAAIACPLCWENRDRKHEFVRLLWPALNTAPACQKCGSDQRWKPSDVNGDNFDILIVDELHKIQLSFQNPLVRIASGFDHVLILTATPTFQDPKRHAQLFEILEPEKTALTRYEMEREKCQSPKQYQLDADIGAWTAQDAQVIVDRFLKRDADAATVANDSELKTSAIVHCAYRRVIRTRRADYPGVFPRRRHLPIVVEPLGAEIDRQALMWEYFRHHVSMTIDVKPIELAKRVILSPPSLEQRVDFLRRKSQDRNGLLDRAKPLVHKSQGDSRADALIDLLMAVWERNSQDKVLVAAQDNLTVDYLFELVTQRLPVVGPLCEREPLVVVRIRQGMMTEAMQGMGGYGNETNDALRSFISGDARLLLAADEYSTGLNIQSARVFVLYSVPWTPVEVSQWIGRVDRIGNIAEAIQEEYDRTIDVYTMGLDHALTPCERWCALRGGSRAVPRGKGLNMGQSPDIDGVELTQRRGMPHGHDRDRNQR